jgi:hypothetical protein
MRERTRAGRHGIPEQPYEGRRCHGGGTPIYAASQARPPAGRRGPALPRGPRRQRIRRNPIDRWPAADGPPRSRGAAGG